jgi:hypothetical protein
MSIFPPTSFARCCTNATLDGQPGQITAALQQAGLTLSGLVDDIAARHAGVEEDLHALLDRAERVVDELDAEPAGFETRDPTYFSRVKRTTAILLANMWSMGRLLGVPVDAWPSADLARQLLSAAERVADLITLEAEPDPSDDDE